MNGEMRRPATAGGTGQGQQVTGRVTLNLMAPVAEQMGRAGEVEALPVGITVVLRVAGNPDPAVLDRLLRWGGHVRYDVHGRDGRCTAAWVCALRSGSVIA